MRCCSGGNAFSVKECREGVVCCSEDTHCACSGQCYTRGTGVFWGSRIHGGQCCRGDVQCCHENIRFSNIRILLCTCKIHRYRVRSIVSSPGYRTTRNIPRRVCPARVGGNYRRVIRRDDARTIARLCAGRHAALHPGTSAGLVCARWIPVRESRAVPAARGNKDGSKINTYIWF